MGHENGNWMNDDQRSAMRARGDLVQRTIHLLLLTDVCMTTPLEQGIESVQKVVPMWTDEQCRQAGDWAIREHLHAGDNDDVERIPAPPHVAALRPSYA